MKFNSHDMKQMKFQDDNNRLLKEGGNNGRLLKEGSGNENLINIYGSQKFEESFNKMTPVQDIKLLKMSSLDAARAKYSPEIQNKFQKLGSLDSSSPKNETKQSKSSPQLCKQMKVEDVTEEDCSDMDVTTYHVTLTYKPRI